MSSRELGRENEGNNGAQFLISTLTEEMITNTWLSMIKGRLTLTLLLLLTCLGIYSRAKAEEESIKIGVFRDLRLWASLYCRGVPIDYLEDLELLPSKGYHLLLVQASEIENPKDLLTLLRYSQEASLFLLGWGPLIDSLPKEEQRLWEELSSSLGLHHLRWVPQGRRWIRLREEEFSPSPGLPTVLDLGEGPSLSAEVQEGGRVLAEWVTSQGTEVEKGRSACLIQRGKHLWLSFDFKMRGGDLDILLNLLLQTLRYSLPELKLRSLPEKQNIPSVKGPPKEQILALPWEVLSSFKEYPPPSSFSPLWNGLALELARAGQALYPSDYQVIAPKSWGNLEDWIVRLKAEGLRLYLLFPLLSAGEKRLQGPLLRYKPDWGLFPPSSTEEFWFNPSLPAFREWSREALAEILKALPWDGVLLTDWIPPREKTLEYLPASRLLVTELCSVVRRIRRSLVIGLEDDGSLGSGLPIDFYFHPQPPKRLHLLSLISFQISPYWWLEPDRWKLEESSLGFLLWWRPELPLQMISLPGPPGQKKMAKASLQDPIATALYYCAQVLEFTASRKVEKALLEINLALSTEEQEKRIHLLKQAQSLLVQELRQRKEAPYHPTPMGDLRRKMGLAIGLISLQVRNEAPTPLPDAGLEPEVVPSR